MGKYSVNESSRPEDPHRLAWLGSLVLHVSLTKYLRTSGTIDSYLIATKTVAQLTTLEFP